MKSETMLNLIKSDLEQKKESWSERSKSHKRIARIYRNWYYTGGISSVILSILIASLSSLDLSSSSSKAIFFLSILNGSITGILSFLGIEKKIADHHSSKISYLHLSKDLHNDLLKNKSKPESLELETLYLEKEKRITQTEPSLDSSLCCSKEDEFLMI
jgi:hypothetical protein